LIVLSFQTGFETTGVQSCALKNVPSFADECQKLLLFSFWTAYGESPWWRDNRASSYSAILDLLQV